MPDHYGAVHAASSLGTVGRSGAFASAGGAGPRPHRSGTLPPSSRRGWMSGVKRWASLPLSSTVTGAASRSMGNPIRRTIVRSMATRCSRSARSPRCSPALVLADMVQRGEVALGRPGAQVPACQRSGCPSLERAPITLLDLATYTSGLPRMPSNFAPKDPEQSLCRLHRRAALRYLSNHKLAKPGRHYEYANLGLGLLGHILELRAGTSYEELVRLADLRAVRHGRHAHHAFGFDAAASGARPQHRVLPPSRTGIFWCLPAPARFVRRRTTC